jgi:hypothetical protein
MSVLKKIPFFLFLLPLFFCLHGSVENYGHLAVAEVLTVGAAILLCIAVFFAFTWLITKNLLFASLLTFFIALWYLFFGAIHDFFKTTPFLHFIRSYTVLLPVLLVVNLLFTWWLKQSKKLYTKLVLYLNVLFIIFCVTDAFLLMNAHNSDINKKNEFIHAVHFEKDKVTAKPNVYFLLFDEYAGYKSLQDSFGFKNDSLYNFLWQQQFQPLPVFSNYDFTPYSMSSILNMQYIPENYNKKLLTQTDIQHRFDEIKNAQVPAIFKSMGYAIENYSIFDIKDYPALYDANGLFPVHTALLTNKIFHKRLIKDIGWWFMRGKIKVQGIEKHIMYRDDVYNTTVKEKLIQTAATKPASPRLCYAHFFLPHGPYFRDSTGAFNTAEKIPDLDNKTVYLSYLKYTNTVMQSLVKNITSSDPTAMVIIMSDHGYYNYDGPGGYSPYNFDNFCHVRFPAAQGTVNLPRSNVNLFRYVFNAAYGQKLAYLPDSSVFVIDDPALLR